MSSDPNDKYFQFPQNVFKGLNLDVPPEKLSPEFFTTFTNMKVDKEGVPKTINGCQIAKAIGKNVLSYGYFQTRGDDYVFVYTSNNTIEIYKYPQFNLKDTLFTSPTLNAPTWFVSHNGEFYMGNMEDGMWRWRPGHQPLIRGSAPMDVLVRLVEEGEAEKELEWLFAYDYEYRGGRSPISRNAGVKLFKNTQKVEITMDTPPNISNNRRVYASPDDGTTWYFVVEIEDSDTSTVELDDELVDRITTAYEYNPDEAKTISPKALMGISHDSMLWLANTVESPTIVQHSEIGQSYFNDTDVYDLLEIPTNVIGHEKYTFVSTPNKIYALTGEPNTSQVIVSEGAFRGSMQIWKGSLVWINEKGFRYFDGKKPDTIPGINSVDFSGLQKEQRWALWTSQQDYNQGTPSDGISTSVIPGAISLQYMKPIVGTGIIERQNNDGYLYPYRDYFVTYTGGYKAIQFIIPGPAGQKFSFSKLGLYMKRYGDFEADFTCEIWGNETNGGDKPDADNVIVSFAEKIGETWKEWPFKLEEYEDIEYNTAYWLIIPQQGQSAQTWMIKRAMINDSDNEHSQMYPYYIQQSDDGDNWSDYILGGCKNILRFSLYGSGAKIFTPSNWSDIENGGETTDVNSWAIRFTVDDETELNRGINFISSTIGLPGDPVITIQPDISGHPEGTGTGTALDYAENYNFGIPLVNYDWHNKYKLQPGTYYWFMVQKIGVGNYREYAFGERHAGDVGKYYGADSNWHDWDKVFFVKLWGNTESTASYATSGSWVSNTIDFSADADFDKFNKLYGSMMLPGTTADIRIDVETDQGSADDVALPYDVNGNHPGATTFKVTVDMELGDALFTPTVDSLLLGFQRTGDTGDKLHSVNLKGSYLVSNEGSTEFSYMLSKWGFWNKLDKAFYGFLPIGDDVVLGIGKNPNAVYKNIYELDKSNVKEWYSGDSGGSIPIDTEIETGYLLYSHIVKEFRKWYLSLQGTADDTWLNIQIKALGAERLSSSDVEGVYPTTVPLYDRLKSIYIDLPDYIEGKYCQLKLYATGVDWALHNYELEYWEQMKSNIAMPDITTYPQYVFYRDFVGANPINIHTLNIKGLLSLDQTLDVGEYVMAVQVYNEYLYAFIKKSDTYPYLYIYKIESDGSLTLKNIGGYKYSALSVVEGSWGYSIVVKSNYVYACSGTDTNTELYLIDVSDKASPVVVNTKDDLYDYPITMDILENELITYYKATGWKKLEFRNLTTLELNSTINIDKTGLCMSVFPNDNLWVYSPKQTYGATEVPLYLRRGKTQIKSINEAGIRDSQFTQMSWNPVNRKLYTIFWRQTAAGNAYMELYVYNQNLDKIEDTSLCYDSSSNNTDAGVFCTIDGYIVIWYGDTTDGFNIQLRRPDDTVVNLLEDDGKYRIRSMAINTRTGYGKTS